MERWPRNQCRQPKQAAQAGECKVIVFVKSAGRQDQAFVIMVPSQQDKRAVNVAITQPGYQAVIENGQLGLQFFNDLFHEFSLEEMETLWNLLKKLYRFDGEAQDGFEEEIDFNPSGGL
jgi:hypothetical protein